MTAMRHFLHYLLFLSIVFVSVGATQATAEPVFGRYVGTLHHEARDRDQLAKLDFIVARSSSNQLELKAVLTLHMGGFDSGEYVNVHFSKVSYNILTGALVFDDPSQPYSLFVRRFSGKELEGEVISSWNGRIGKLSLHTDASAVVPKRPLIEPLWGEYKGNCGPDRAKIQIYTYRNPEITGHLSQPYSAYSIKANLPMSCRDGQCVNLRYVSGTYNFLAKTGQLNLVGSRTTLQCTVDGDELRCSTPDIAQAGFFDLTDCRFQRTSKETAEPRTLEPPRKSGGYNVSLDPSAEGSLDKAELGLLQSGEYRGHVFHEYLGRYQAASLNLFVFPGEPGESTRISASGKLFFGDHSSNEVIPYRFSQVDYPNPTVWPQNLVLSRSEEDVDAVVQITEVGKDKIRGFWYSNLFGRVGPFEMQRGGIAPAPDGAEKIEPLSGYYLGQDSYQIGSTSRWELRLQVIGGQVASGSGNPFFPLTIRGSMYLFPITAAIPIVTGSYDFYTGRFALMKGDKGIEHGFIGNQVTRDRLELHHAPLPVLTPVPSFRPQVFKLIKGFP